VRESAQNHRRQTWEIPPTPYFSFLLAQAHLGHGHEDGVDEERESAAGLEALRLSVRHVQRQQPVQLGQHLVNRATWVTAGVEGRLGSQTRFDSVLTATSLDARASCDFVTLRILSKPSFAQSLSSCVEA
jgi:hypothetical protein